MPAERAWLADLLSDTRAVATRLLDEPVLDLSELHDQIDAYATTIREQGSARTDMELAEALLQGVRELLHHMEQAPSHARRLAQVAVRYFVIADDGDDDLASPFGFDDDVEVFNAVVARLGLTELQIAYAS